MKMFDDPKRELEWLHRQLLEEEEETPDTAFDTLFVFRSYGILHIVGQEGKQAFHATVEFSDPQDEPCWELWLRALEEKLCQ